LVRLCGSISTVRVLFEEEKSVLEIVANEMRGARAKRMSPWRARIRRAGWGLADQSLSSLTNFALGIVVARSVSAREFGDFSVAFAVYMLVLGLARSTSTEPLLVRFSKPSDPWARGASSAAGAAAVVGVISGAGCILAGLVLSGGLGGALIGLGITLPGLLVQDAWRFAFFAQGRAGQAFVNDLVWTVALVVTMGLVVFLGTSSVLWFVIAWGGAATAGAVAGLLQSWLLPRPDRSLSWWREHSDLLRDYVAQFSVLQGSVRLADFGVGAVAGVRALGSLRGAQMLLGPLNVLVMGSRLVAVPEAVRLLDSSPHRLRRACALVSAALASAAITWGIVLTMLPRSAGEALLGATWVGAQRVMFPLALAMAGSGIAMGAGVGLRAMLENRRATKVRMVISILTVAAAVGGAAIAGAFGAAWGVAAVAFPGGALWWIQLNRAIADRSAPGGPEMTAEVPRPVL
jgi:O-antigen/teichoic acid export membrane protein